MTEYDGQERKRDMLGILTRLDSLEKSVLRIETRLFDNGLIGNVDHLASVIQKHGENDSKIKQLVGQHAVQISTLMWLFGGLTLGLLFLVVKNGFAK